MQGHEMRSRNNNAQYQLDRHPLYSRDADRPTAVSSSACSTPRSPNSYSSSATDVSPGRLLIPRDIQSPSQVVAQIRGAHKQLLYLSRNNFVQPDEPGSSSYSEQWQHAEDQHPDHQSLDRISEVSDSSYSQDHSQSGTPHFSPSTHYRGLDLQHHNEHLARQLHVMWSDMEQQQHEHFRLRQEQQLQLEDLKAHVADLENQLQDHQDSTTELLSVNNFLDTQLKKHKDQLHSARQSTLRYHRQMQQDQQEQTDLRTQLQDTQTQLAAAIQESKQQQQQIDDLQRQVTSVAKQEISAQQLSDAQQQLASAKQELASSRQELAAANHDKQQLGKARETLTADLKEVNTQLMGLQSALTEAFQEQDIAVKRATEQFQAQHAQQAQTAAEKLSAATFRSQQLESQLADLEQQLQQVHTSSKNAEADQHSTAAQEHQQLANEVSSLRQQLQEAQRSAQEMADSQKAVTEENKQLTSQMSSFQKQLLQAQDSAAQQHSQLEVQVAHLEAQLQQTQASSSSELSKAADHSRQLEEQVTTAKQELQQAQEAHTAATSESARHSQELEAQLLEIQQQLQQAHDSAAADASSLAHQQEQFEAHSSNAQQTEAAASAEQATAAQHAEQLTAQLRDLEQQLQHAQASAEAQRQTAAELKQELEAQLTHLRTDLQQAEVAAEQSSAEQSLDAQQSIAKLEAQVAELQRQVQHAEASAQQPAAQHTAAAQRHTAQLEARVCDLQQQLDSAQALGAAESASTPTHDEHLSAQQQHEQGAMPTTDRAAQSSELRQRVAELEQQELHQRHAQGTPAATEHAEVTQSSSEAGLPMQQMRQQLQRAQSQQALNEQAQREQSAAEQQSQLTHVDTQEVQQLHTQLEQAQQEVQQSAQEVAQLTIANRQYVDHAGFLQGQLADLRRQYAAQGHELDGLRSELHKAHDTISQQPAQPEQATYVTSDEQAAAHAKEVAQLTEAHTQLQTLIDTLTEENAQLSQANTDRSMHIGTLAADLDQAKDTTPTQPIELPPATETTSDLLAEQAVAHAKEVAQLTEAHTQLQDLVNTLTEDNARLDQDNAKRSMHIGSLAAGLDQAKRAHSDNPLPVADVSTEAQQSKEPQPRTDSSPSTNMSADTDSGSRGTVHSQAEPVPSDQNDVTSRQPEVHSLREQVAGLQSQHEELTQQLTAASQSSESEVQAAEQALQAQHAQQVTALKTEFECLLEDYTAKDQQVQELMAKLETVQQAAERSHTKDTVADESDKVTHLTDINKQLEGHVTSLDSQLEQLQQELEAASMEAAAAAAHAQSAHQADLDAQRAQHETRLSQSIADLEAAREECSAKALQVQQLLTEVDQLNEEREGRQGQVQKLQTELEHSNDETNCRVQQVEEQLEALQQEHHRLNETHLDLERQNKMLQEECNQLQGYISVLDEDLWIAQEKIGSALADGDDSAANQNEMLKAAAKQVCQIQSTNAKRSKMPKLLRKFGSRKKDRGSILLEEPATPKSAAVQAASPRASALPPFHAALRQSQRNSTEPNSATPRFGGDAAHFVQTTGGQISIDVLQPSFSGMSTESPAEMQKLKDENLLLAEKLAAAEHAVAELNGRLVDAAFGADTVGKAGGRSVRRTMSAVDHTDASSFAEQESSTMAPSNSSEYISLAGMPPGVPLDPIYD